jgi:hypothetical protein
MLQEVMFQANGWYEREQFGRGSYGHNRIPLAQKYHGKE